MVSFVSLTGNNYVTSGNFGWRISPGKLQITLLRYDIHIVAGLFVLQYIPDYLALTKEVEQQTGINRRTFRRYRQEYGVIRVEKEKRPTQ